MKRTVRVLRRAQRDVQEIYDYLNREAPTSADEIVDEILEAIESLTTLSARGARPRDATLRAAEFRFLVVGVYLVFYKTVGKQVRVYRVLYGRRAYRELL